MPYYDVCVAACKSYNEPDIKETLCGIINKADGFSFLQKGMTVGIKTNLVSAMKPERAATTHPALIKALCDILLERGAGKVIIGDSPGGLYSPAFLDRAYRISGLSTLEDERVFLNDDYSTEILDFPDGKLLKSFTGTAWLRKVDVIINFSKLKTHGMMGMSCAVKNLFGTVPGTMKAEFHSRFSKHGDFAEMLVDLNEFWKPALCICDAVTGMEGNGPTAGTPRDIGALLCSRSPYKLDLVAAELIGLTASSIPTLGAAFARGYAPDNVKKLDIYGNPDEFHVKDFKNVAERKNVDFGTSGNTATARLLYGIAGVVLRSKPKPEAKLCIGCGKCAEVCPEKTIKIIGKKAKIHRKNCIRCFCCQEFCPVGAMKVKRSAICRILVK